MDPQINKKRYEIKYFKRISVSVIDYFCIVIALGILDIFISESPIKNLADTTFVSWYFPVLILVIYMFYFVYMTMSGGTFGQKLCKISVVDYKTLEKPTLYQSLLREFIVLISFIGFGIIVNVAIEDANQQDTLTGIMLMGFITTLLFGFYWDKATNLIEIKTKDLNAYIANPSKHDRPNDPLKINRCPKCEEQCSFNNEYLCENCGQTFWQSKEKFDNRKV